MKTLTKTLTILLMMLLAVSCSKDEGLLTPGDELSDVLKKAEVIDDVIYLSGKTLFDVVAPKMNENKVIISSEWMWLYLYAKITPNPEKKGYYKLLTREYMPEFDQLGNPSRGFEYRVIEFDVRITPGGAVQYFMPDTWWELGSWIPYENAVAQVIAHTGLDVKGPGVNQGTIMYEGYFKGGKFFASCHLSGLQVDPEPTMDIYWNLDGPVKLDFSMVMDVCDGCSGSPWDDDLPWE